MYWKFGRSGPSGTYGDLKLEETASDRTTAGFVSNLPACTQIFTVSYGSFASKAAEAPPVRAGLAGAALFGASSILGSRMVKVEPWPGSLATVALLDRVPGKRTARALAKPQFVMAIIAFVPEHV